MLGKAMGEALSISSSRDRRSGVRGTPSSDSWPFSFVRLLQINSNGPAASWPLPGNSTYTVMPMWVIPWKRGAFSAAQRSETRLDRFRLFHFSLSSWWRRFLAPEDLCNSACSAKRRGNGRPQKAQAITVDYIISWDGL